MSLACSRANRPPAQLFRQSGNDGRDEGRSKVGTGSPTQDNQEFSIADCLRSVFHQIRDAQECFRGEPEVPVVPPVGVKAEIPHHQVWTELPCPVRENFTHKVEVSLVGGSVESGGRGGNVHLCSIRRSVVHTADTDVQHLGIICHEITRPVGVVGIRVQDGHPSKPADASCLADRDDHIVEAAVASKEVSPGVVATSPDKAEGIAQLPRPDAVHAFHHAPHGGARRGSEWISLHFRDQMRVVRQKDHLIADWRALKEFDVRHLEE